MPEPADLKSSSYSPPLETFDPLRTYYISDADRLEDYRRAILFMERDFAAAMQLLRGQLNLEFSKYISLRTARMNASALIDSSLTDLGVRMSVIQILVDGISPTARQVASPINVQATISAPIDAILARIRMLMFYLSRPQATPQLRGMQTGANVTNSPFGPPASSNGATSNARLSPLKSR